MANNKDVAPIVPDKFSKNILKNIKSLVGNNIYTRRRRGIPIQAQIMSGRAPIVSKAPKTWFDDSEKLNAAALYTVCGNLKEVERMTGISYNTLKDWKETEWWATVILKIREEADDVLDAKATKIVDKALEKIMDRIENGDMVWNAKAGKAVPVPVKARDLATVTNTILDKRQLLRGKPTSISAKTSEDTRLKALASEFEKFVKARTIEHEARPTHVGIEGEVHVSISRSGEGEAHQGTTEAEDQPQAPYTQAG